MAELHVVEDERPGIKKEIDDGAMDLIFQAIQEDIYSFPIKSFVRESISNGLDAITERNISQAIESGHPVEDYYLQRQDGKLLKDSAFDAEYYNTENQSDSQAVLVTYREREGRDLISVKDEGVGLGGSRLKGFFKLGYSSKRNMKDVIGKFGAGAKAGLATGVEYFVMHTVYNGYKTSFMIFKHDYDPITPKNESAKVEQWTVPMSNGETQVRNIYWTETTEKNGVQIDLEVKKHNQQLFLDAVTSQFQYFNGRVHLNYISDYGNAELDTLNSKPEYESNALLIPKYSTYSSPHILVDGISYGLISWDELELERRQGKIAIKVAATDVDITQSRESLKWTEKTKKTILRAIDTAREEAEAHIASLLTIENPDDLLGVNRLYGTLSRGADESVGTIFSKFLDMHNITPKFRVKLNTAESFDAHLHGGYYDVFSTGMNIKKLKLTSSGGKTKIQSTRVESFYDLRNTKIIYADNNSVGPKLVSHLLNKFDVSSIVYARPIGIGAFEPNELIRYGKRDFTSKVLQTYAKHIFKTYSDLDIDTYDVVYTEKEEDLEKEQEVTTQSTAVLRKANKEVLYTDYTYEKNKYRNNEFLQERHTVKISELNEEFQEYKAENLIICTGKFKNLGRMLELTQDVFNNEPLKVIYVAQDVTHHFAPYGTVITDYFRTVNTKTGELMVGTHIRNLNTWRVFYQIMKEYPEYSQNDELLKAFTSIDMDTYTFIKENSKDLSPREIIEKNSTMKEEVLNDIFSYLEGLKLFQETVRTADATKIASHAQELFMSDEVYQIDAYDDVFIGVMRSEFERLAPIREMLDLFSNHGDFKSAQPLIELLLTTVNTQK